MGDMYTDTAYKFRNFNEDSAYFCNNSKFESVIWKKTISCSAKTPKHIPNRSKGTIGAIPPFETGAGLVLGQLLEDSACKILPILNLCKNDDDLSQDVGKVL